MYVLVKLFQPESSSLLYLTFDYWFRRAHSIEKSTLPFPMWKQFNTPSANNGPFESKLRCSPPTQSEFSLPASTACRKRKIHASILSSRANGIASWHGFACTPCEEE